MPFNPLVMNYAYTFLTIRMGNKRRFAMWRSLICAGIMLISTTACASGAPAPSFSLQGGPKMQMGRWDIVPSGSAKKFEVKFKTRFF